MTHFEKRDLASSTLTTEERTGSRVNSGPATSAKSRENRFASSVNSRIRKAISAAEGRGGPGVRNPPDGLIGTPGGPSGSGNGLRSAIGTPAGNPSHRRAWDGIRTYRNAGSHNVPDREVSHLPELSAVGGSGRVEDVPAVPVAGDPEGHRRRKPDRDPLIGSGARWSPPSVSRRDIARRTRARSVPDSGEIGANRRTQPLRVFGSIRPSARMPRSRSWEARTGRTSSGSMVRRSPDGTDAGVRHTSRTATGRIARQGSSPRGRS
jgi:hypothetical protein